MAVRLLKAYPGDAQYPTGLAANYIYDGPQQDYFVEIGLADRRITQATDFATYIAAKPNAIYPIKVATEENAANDLWATSRNIGFMPTGLILDGTTDNTTAIQNAFAISKVVRLPAGSLKANINPPSGCTLVGAGKLLWDRASSWVGTGTLILGLVTLTGATDVQMSDLSIDNYASGFDAIDIKSDASRRIQVRRVSTRANNHNVLCEKNLNTGNPSTDAIGAVWNNILFEDCEFNGGPNGIAIKMRGVNVVRCVAYDVTVQAFVAVSDCINGAGSYSRARDVTFKDCYGVGCAQNLHIYSRDNQSATNTSGVLGATNIRWMGGALSDATGNAGAQIGDGASLPGGTTQIQNIGVWITDADIRNNAQAGIQWDAADMSGYDRNNFDANGTAGGSNANVGVRTNGGNLASGLPAVTRLTHGKSNAVSSTCLGVETGVIYRQASAQLTSGQRGLIQSNQGATGSITLTLPNVAYADEGDEHSFAANTAQNVVIVSQAPTTNYLRSDLTRYASFTSTGVGCFITVKAVKHNSGVLEWWVIAMRGTWTLA